MADYDTKLLAEPGWTEGGYIGWQVGSGGFTVGPHDQGERSKPDLASD